jgi:sugar phosphate isomerase/epimerase
MSDNWMQCIIRAAEMGFDGIELFGSEYENEQCMERSLLRNYAVAAREKRIQLSAHPWMNWSNLPISDARANLHKLFECCVSMEMREINIHFAFLTDRNQGFKRLFDILDPEIPFLAKHQATVLFENVPAHGIRELGSEVEDFDNLFDHYGIESPVMMTIDTGHAHIAKNMQPLMARWGKRWRYTHINDNDGLNDCHWRPGQGTVDWNLIASLAKQVSYEGPLMMEYNYSGLSDAMPVLTKAFTEEGYRLAPLIIREPDR